MRRRNRTECQTDVENTNHYESGSAPAHQLIGLVLHLIQICRGGASAVASRTTQVGAAINVAACGPITRNAAKAR